MPTVSSESAYDTTPQRLSMPYEGLKPYTPQYDAGLRTEPPVSVRGARRPGDAGGAAGGGVSGARGDDGASWEVLQAGPGDANDASVALLVRVAGLDVVALGDLEDAGQAALARTLGERGTGPVDVVKVAHHGSATQSDRLAQVLAPTVALVSSGENTYGHPTDRALDLYRAVGATVLRTDACGTIALVVRDDVLSAAGCG